MNGIYPLIGIIIVFFLLKKSKSNNSHEIINEKDQLTIKYKKILKKRMQKDLKNNKVVHVFVSIHSRKYHKHNCRFYNDSMTKLPLNTAIKEGFIPCKICYKNQK